jgi:hypothetical protein
MKEVWQRISAEPAVATGAVVASINVVAAFGAWTPTPMQLAAVNSALVAIFALLIRATVDHKYGTPVQLRRARPRQARKQAKAPRETEPVQG